MPASHPAPLSFVAAALLVVGAALAGCAPEPVRSGHDAGSNGKLGDPCDFGGDCLSQLCDARRCVPNECTVDADCEAGLVCEASCGHTCIAPGARGDTCYESSDVPRCEPYRRACSDGLACAVIEGGFAPLGRCVPPTGRSLEEPCEPDAGPDVCGADLVCVTTCLLVDGVSCERASQCASGVCFETCGACDPTLAACDGGV